MAVRRLEQRLLESISREGDWRGALFDSGQTLLQPLRASGAALLFEGQAMVTGDVPSREELRAIGDWWRGGATRPCSRLRRSAETNRRLPGCAGR